jgi:hypothetical protein
MTKKEKQEFEEIYKMNVNLISKIEDITDKYSNIAIKYSDLAHKYSDLAEKYTECKQDQRKIGF